VPLVAGVAFLAAFTLYALRRTDPLVDLRLLRTRSVGSSVSLLFLSGCALYGAMLLLPLYYQEVRGASALTAGLMLVPQGIGTLLSRQVTGSLVDDLGARPIALAGFLVVAAATVPFCFAGGASNPWLLALWLVVRGVGLGAVTLPIMAASYLGLERRQIPHSSVLTRTAQQLGGSFGTAVLAVILQRSGFHAAFWWATGFALLATLLCTWLPGRPHPAAPEPTPGARLTRA
jgi:predicted MFS family arabinose efflux permease